MDLALTQYARVLRLRAQTTTEYAPVMIVVVLVAIAGFTTMGSSLSSLASSITTKL